MPETFTDRLAIAAEQLGYTLEQMHEHGLEDGDFAGAVQYLVDLMDHAFQVASLALTAVEQRPAGHPLRGIPVGIEVQTDLGHLMHLIDAATAFAANARGVLDQLAT